MRGGGGACPGAPVPRKTRCAPPQPLACSAKLLVPLYAFASPRTLVLHGLPAPPLVLACSCACCVARLSRAPQRRRGDTMRSAHQEIREKSVGEGGRRRKTIQRATGPEARFGPRRLRAEWGCSSSLSTSRACCSSTLRSIVPAAGRTSSSPSSRVRVGIPSRGARGGGQLPRLSSQESRQGGSAHGLRAQSGRLRAGCRASGSDVWAEAGFRASGSLLTSRSHCSRPPPSQERKRQGQTLAPTGGRLPVRSN